MTALDAMAAGVTAVGWCLVNFVWQAAVIGALYAVARAVLPRGNARYLAALLALLALAVWPLATAWQQWAAVSAAVNLPDVVVAAGASSGNGAVADAGWHTWVNALLPWLVFAWAICVAVLGARVVRQWRGLRRLLRQAQALPEWQARARAFAARMGLARVVPVLASARVATPTLLGWVRPAVVLPLALLARMPAAQIDLVLAHELAHLKRLDHIANLFQVMLETLFFYHPVVHWISRDARNERELCCDALALAATGGERRDFVAALASLAEFREVHAGLALAASGGVLAERAWFIAGAAHERQSRHLPGTAAMAVAAALLLVLGWLAWRDAAGQRQIGAIISGNQATVVGAGVQAAREATLLLPAFAPRVQVHVPALPYTASVRAPLIAAVPVPAPIRIDGAADVGVAVPEFASPPLPIATRVAAAPAAAPASAGDDAASAAPAPVHSVRPVYPSGALLNGVEGRVVVTFSLDAAGVPHALEVQGAGGPFDAAALQALASWRFAPPAHAGVRYRQAFSFRIGQGGASDAAAARACLVTTGTHICRPVRDAAAGISVLRAGR